jgi:hypothetical protein
MTMPGFPDNWNEPSAALLDQLTHNAVFAADSAIIALDRDATGHVKTKAAVRAAVRMLLANGLVTAVPQEDWPEYVRIDAPGE